MLNKKIIDTFEKLISYETNAFKLKAYIKNLNVIKNLKFEIKSSNDVKDIKGFGKGTLNRIDEILKTGNLEEISDNETNYEAIKELEVIIGIGKKMAKMFVEKYKIKNVDELIKMHEDKKIKLNDKILLGIKYHGKFKEKIPRKEMEKINNFLLFQANKISDDLEINLCGSYRRGLKFSNDIDVLLFHPKIQTDDVLSDLKKYNIENYLHSFKNLLTDKKFIVDDITNKDYIKSYMGFCKYENEPIRRIDIKMYPYNSYYTALLYFTGPYELNTKMRSRAKKLGYKLNEYGLFKGDTKQKINSEKDVFDKLGFEYLTPIERQNKTLKLK